MADSAAFQIIAHIHTDFPTKFGIPRQSGLIDALQAVIVFTPAYRNPDALRGLDGYSHLWLLWQFSEAIRHTWSPTVRPPRLGGNVRMGVFATRSPFRPNPIGLSSVRLDHMEQHPMLGTILHVRGADLMDGTPIYDIKPYLPFTDSHPHATAGFADATGGDRLSVVCPQEYLTVLPETQRDALLSVLAGDPRPSYQDDPERIYGFFFADTEIHFSVAGRILRVHEIKKRSL